MMNTFKSVMYLAIRGYRNKQHGKSYKDNASAFTNLKENELYSQNTDQDSNDHDFDNDYDKDEADFTGIHKTHKQLER